ncbi:tRNA synthetases class I (C) catalytic domain-containing protein [Aspergillus californicus]
MASEGRKQPPWIPPKTRPDTQLPPLKIYNSLTRSKDDFVPLDPAGKTVTWYGCGPTVYEDAHLGHAKNYVSTDIIRRIMQDYFGFNHLPSMPLDVSPGAFYEAADKAYKENAEQQGQAVTVADLLPGKTARLFFCKTDDILLPYLDALYGSEVDSNTHEIYMVLSQKFERRFFEDMEALNIVRFVEKIVANGFGYATADGSVYFDIDSFEKAGHSYSRLEPWNKNDRALQDDGKGSLSKGRSMKRNENHFALWKASKPGEPAWPSPRGHGRPGWHIECSAIASEVIGKAIDIHSGGVDLRFPHHDNELAQSEAYWSTPGCQVQWTNYFIHMGQLRIRGLKMSKSLKNYTTIRSVLSEKEWTARSLRICFLLMPWQDGIEVTEELMKAVVGWEGKLNNFFLKSLDISKHSSPTTTPMQKLSIADQELSSALEKARADVDSALCDSLNTSAAMRILSVLVTETNSAEALSDQTVILLARWVTRIVTIFGLDPEGNLNNPDRIGWSGLDIPAPAKPYVYPASQLRDKVRTLACSGSVDHAAIVKLTDEITIAGSTPVIESSKPYDQVLQQFRTDLLIEALAEQGLAGTAKTKAKLEQEARDAEREKELRERAKVDPLLMFRTSDEYLEWDESGIPTVDVAGDWEKQKKRHEEWLATQQAA